MKRVIQFFVFGLMAFLIKSSQAQNTIPTLKNRSKSGILTYFNTVVKNGQVIVGQQCSETPDVALDYKNNFQRLYDSTGKYPALLGLEYGYFPNINFDKTNQYALQHWKNGGLVTISFHADNPFADGYNVRWNSIKNKDSIDLKKLCKNAADSKEKSIYRTELAQVAKALKQLKDAGVVVLWRPFHEVNGNWFWWGINDWKHPTNQKDYAALWKDMYETLTKDFGLDNLIWVYSPNTPQGAVWPAIASMYPGDDYVDVVGTDIYPQQLSFDDYNDLKQFKKVVANGEVGPSKESFGKFDEMEVLNIFRGKAAYFLQWHSWTNAKVAIVDNLNYKEMMNDPATITLDKLR